MSGWLKDLSRGDNWKEQKPSGSRSGMNRARWSIEEVMYYYGKWIENKESAAFIMENIERRIGDFGRVSFTHRMNMVRDYLMYEYRIKNIPFIVSYRRLK